MTANRRSSSFGGRNGVAGYRSDFRRDYARLLHSPAFRRLQGKTQLFPGIESDFFRNRLTHSLEVAQIAKSIALRLNRQDGFLRRDPIDLDLIETAALAHDLGHPPFGHNGEEALDACMRCMGGFEGNAQTLRILARPEKKQPDVPIGSKVDDGVGLDLTYRTLASVLKYDSCIPLKRKCGARISKGYCCSERVLVERIKKAVLRGGTAADGGFKTIECGIMDLADDVAYSTYDLEDAFKAGFVTPCSWSSRHPTRQSSHRSQIKQICVIAASPIVRSRGMPCLVRNREGTWTSCF